MSRPHAGDDVKSVPRRQLLQPKKLEAEGRLAEEEVVLGWLLDTYLLLVRLPYDKYKVWHKDLRDIFEKEKVEFLEFESLIGRLNHASFIVPLS